MIKILASTVAVLLASTTVASAESFTFTSTATIANQVGGPVAGGKPVGASFSNGESDTTFASGKKAKSKLQCANWSAQPGQLFTSIGFCTADDGTSKYTVAFSCQATDEKNTASDCWGRLTGVSGAYQGKVGTASWHGAQNADGKSGTATGQGAWN